MGKKMIEIVENILGITLGDTAYDDIILAGAFILGLTAILIVVQVFKSLLDRR